MQVRLRLTVPKSLERRLNRPRYPSFHADLKIAILKPDLSERQLTRRTRKCRAVAGTVPMLRRLADAVESGAMSLPQLAGAVVFTGMRHEELTELERDRFWGVLGTPVYEHRLGPEGQVIAMECEAHELHLLDRDAPLAGLRVQLDQKICACGNRQPRVRHIEKMRPSPAPALVRPAVAAHIDEHGDQQHEQVHPAGRVA